MAISTWRAHDLEQYEKEKTPEDGIENAILCEKYSEAELPFSWDDAIFWLKNHWKFEKNCTEKIGRLL